MQSVSSRIWTRVTVSNSYDDNHNSTGTANDGKMDSAWRPSWSIYEMASIYTSFYRKPTTKILSP